MKRVQAVEWQAFLLELTGTTNYFLLCDPDGKTPRGTYDASSLLSDIRVDSGSQVTSTTLSFVNSTSRISSTSVIFDGLDTGDFITVSGTVNEANAGTHKISSVVDNQTIVVTTTLVTESSTAACKVRQNVKGSTGLSLDASSNSATGTILKGDYLAIYDGTSLTANNPIQLVMATENATLNTQGGSAADHYSVAIQPKLRQDLTNNYRVGYASTHNKSRFRLTGNSVEWGASNLSLYGLSLDAVEVL